MVPAVIYHEKLLLEEHSGLQSSKLFIHRDPAALHIRQSGTQKSPLSFNQKLWIKYCLWYSVKCVTTELLAKWKSQLSKAYIPLSALQSW